MSTDTLELPSLDTARRAFDAALRLLRLEDEARILLYGGGFPRAALLRLCRAEAAACREGP
jgi:chemotaxis protein methyltransferase CheR